MGLFIGAWGMSNALSRLVGSVLGGAVRDMVSRFAQDAVIGYAVVFIIEAVMLAVSLLLLRGIDVKSFRRQTQSHSFVERAALASDA